ncbi:MAG: DUF362 domain-containing protein [Oligoflexia bacterium]|nr:DUF362 domain-containing protein [Oligoflexia bacterium]
MSGVSKVILVVFIIICFSINKFALATNEVNTNDVNKQQIQQQQQQQQQEIYSDFLQDKSVNEIKKSMKKIFQKAGVHFEPGKRYFLKISHNNGAGVDGYHVDKNKEIPSFLSAMMKSIKGLFASPKKLPEKKNPKNSLSELDKNISNISNTSTSNDNNSELVIDNEVKCKVNSELSKYDKLEKKYNPALFKFVLKTARLVLKPLEALTSGGAFNPSWDVIGYPSVSNPKVVEAFVQIVKEANAEAWVGDESGIESPDTFNNMKKSGIVDAVKRAGGHLWIFNQGLIDFSGKKPKVLSTVDGVHLNKYSAIKSEHFNAYPNSTISIPTALLDEKFFSGIFFTAHPKSHLISAITGNIKNFVGLMQNSDRKSMHNLNDPHASVWKIVSTSNQNSIEKMAQTAYGISQILKTKTMGYLGDNIATITNMGPDVGPNVTFNKKDWALTFSKDLYAQEVAAMILSYYSVKHLIENEKDQKALKLRLNAYFRNQDKDPLNYDLLNLYSKMDKNSQERKLHWNISGDNLDKESEFFQDIEKESKKHPQINPELSK